MPEQSEVVAWVTAGLLAAERGWKFLSDYRSHSASKAKLQMEERQASTEEGANLFKRAVDMIEVQRKEMEGLRERHRSALDELAVRIEALEEENSHLVEHIESIHLNLRARGISSDALDGLSEIGLLRIKRSKNT